MLEKNELRSLKIEGCTYKTRFTKKYENRKRWQKADPKQLEAYIPGTILEIFVKEGQKVNEGEELLILEAMKMKNIITAPISGVIKSIFVSEGRVVPKGFVMLEFALE